MLTCHSLLYPLAADRAQGQRICYVLAPETFTVVRFAVLLTKDNPLSCNQSCGLCTLLGHLAHITRSHTLNENRDDADHAVQCVCATNRPPAPQHSRSDSLGLRLIMDAAASLTQNVQYKSELALFILYFPVDLYLALDCMFSLIALQGPPSHHLNHQTTQSNMLEGVQL